MQTTTATQADRCEKCGRELIEVRDLGSTWIECFDCCTTRKVEAPQ